MCVVTDASGCSASAEVEVAEPALLSVELSGSDVACFGDWEGGVDVLVTGGSGPYTYAWSTGATTEDVWGLEAGVYSVTGTQSGDAGVCECVVYDLVSVV